MMNLPSVGMAVLKLQLTQPLVAQNRQNLGNYARAAVSSTVLITSSSMQQAVGARFHE